MFFKTKSNSPNNKFINVTTSLGNDRNVLKPLLTSKEVNSSPNEKFKLLKINSDAYFPNTQNTGFLTFKNRSKNKNQSFKRSVFFNKEK